MNFKHGATKTPEFWIWRTMKVRCHNPNSAGYPNYGGRGIKVCEDWKKNFSKFLADMGRRPSESHSLERIDNNAGYSSNNCRWATKREQGQNRRTSRFITYLGRTQTITDWAREIGLSKSQMKKRIDAGWALNKALLTKPLPHPLRKKFNPL